MSVNILSVDELVEIMFCGGQHVLVADTRSILEYNDNHIRGAVNVSCSKLVKRKLQNDIISVIDLLDSFKCKWSGCKNIVAYDQATWDFNFVPVSHLFHVFVTKAVNCFSCVFVVKGKIVVIYLFIEILLKLLQMFFLTRTVNVFW